MSGVTDNYGLITVVKGEAYDEEVFNSNVKAIDAQMKIQELAQKKIKRAEFIGASNLYPVGSATWGPGVLTLDAATGVNQTVFNNTFAIYNNSGDQLKILEAGLYLFEWLIATTSLPPGGEVTIKNTTLNRNIVVGDLQRGVSWGPQASGTAYVNANDLVNFFTINRSAQFTASSRVMITKLQG